MGIVKHLPAASPIPYIKRVIYLGANHTILNYLHRRTGQDVIIAASEGALNEIIDTIFEWELANRSDITLVADGTISKHIWDIAARRGLSLLVPRPVTANWRY